MQEHRSRTQHTSTFGFAGAVVDGKDIGWEMSSGRENLARTTPLPLETPFLRRAEAVRRQALDPWLPPAMRHTLISTDTEYLSSVLLYNSKI
jgi:hypothetical protein